MVDRGITPAQIAARAQLGFAVGVDFFMEAAKLRAARILWAKTAGGFGADGDAQNVFLAARTATWDKTLYDPHVNLLRITTQAFSAVVGCAEAIDIRPFDEVTGNATELGERLSRNLHEILAKEFCLEHQVDPAGGSWYVEVLTDQLARRAWALFQEIERQGGMVKAVLAGYPQGLVAKAAADRQALVDTRRRPILGVTVQPNLREEPRPVPAAAVGEALLGQHPAQGRIQDRADEIAEERGRIRQPMAARWPPPGPLAVTSISAPAMRVLMLLA